MIFAVLSSSRSRVLLLSLSSFVRPPRSVRIARFCSCFCYVRSACNLVSGWQCSIVGRRYASTIAGFGSKEIASKQVRGSARRCHPLSLPMSSMAGIRRHYCHCWLLCLLWPDHRHRIIILNLYRNSPPNSCSASYAHIQVLSGPYIIYIYIYYSIHHSFIEKSQCVII